MRVREIKRLAPADAMTVSFQLKGSGSWLPALTHCTSCLTVQVKIQEMMKGSVNKEWSCLYFHLFWDSASPSPKCKGQPQCPFGLFFLCQALSLCVSWGIYKTDIQMCYLLYFWNDLICYWGEVMLILEVGMLFFFIFGSMIWSWDKNHKITWRQLEHSRFEAHSPVPYQKSWPS